MHSLIATGALFCSLVLAGCGGGYGSDTPADGETGIRGVVQAGPQCAVEVAESPCPDLPWDGIVRVSAGGDEVAEISTDAKGQFRVAVEPGTYDVVPVVGDGIGSSQSQTVTVVEGRLAAVALSVDTGIR